MAHLYLVDRAGLKKKFKSQFFTWSLSPISVTNLEVPAARNLLDLPHLLAVRVQHWHSALKIDQCHFTLKLKWTKIFFSHLDLQEVHQHLEFREGLLALVALVHQVGRFCLEFQVILVVPDRLKTSEKNFDFNMRRKMTLVPGGPTGPGAPGGPAGQGLQGGGVTPH